MSQALPIKIGFAGDVMLGRYVSEYLQNNPPEYVWGDLLDEIKSLSLRVINLECALTEESKTSPKVFHFKSHPKNILSLTSAHIDIVNLANNHVLDFCQKGLEDTLSLLKKANIRYVGAGKNAHEAFAPSIVHVQGIRVGVVGFSDNEPSWQAHAKKPGIAYIDLHNTQAVEAMIKKIRPRVDILIVSLHVGPNFNPEPRVEYQAFARRLIDLGVSVIHGHSSHIFQGVEVYKDGLILYDTGDFIDDYAVDPIYRNDLSFLFTVEATKACLQSLSLTPIKIASCQVNKASGDERKWLERRMKLLSLKFNTTFKERADGLYIQL